MWGEVSISKKFCNKYPCGNISTKPNEDKDTGSYILAIFP